MTMPSWCVMAGAIVTAVAMAAMIIRNRRSGSERAAGRQLAADVETWLRDRQRAME